MDIDKLKSEFHKIQNNLCIDLMKIIEENDKVKLSYEESLSLFTTYWIKPVDSNNYETEFRFLFIGNIFIISRVSFLNKRMGCMTKCFQKILEYSDIELLDFDRIRIQSVISYEMSEWCKKNDFKQCDIRQPFINDNKERNFQLGDREYCIYQSS